MTKNTKNATTRSRDRHEAGRKAAKKRITRQLAEKRQRVLFEGTRKPLYVRRYC